MGTWAYIGPAVRGVNLRGGDIPSYENISHSPLSFRFFIHARGEPKLDFHLAYLKLLLNSKTKNTKDSCSLETLCSELTLIGAPFMSF